MSGRLIMALDQGTTSSRCIMIDGNGNSVALSQREFRQIYPAPGMVEHDPLEIWESQLGVAREALKKSGAAASDIAAIGVTNQRESVVMWEKSTGRPICNAIVWQCRRTAPLCEELRSRGLEELFREKTGLVLDPYFSGTKIRWMLDNVPGARNRAESGELLCGTVDCWLLWNLSGGRVHATDETNASRTLLYNIHTREWDAELLNILDIPISILPEVKPSSGYFGSTALFGGEIPVCGMAGDQQAALFGQRCFLAGDAKNTYGTGCFLLMNTGDRPVRSRHGLLTTVAASADGAARYALEGSIFSGGSVVQWLRDELGLIGAAAETESLAASAGTNAGVYIVPAFTGLGAPYWNASARGTVVGLTRGAGRAHIARAALESMAFQTCDVLAAMERDAGVSLSALKADGGASANGFLMQFQSDILGKPVVRPHNAESTAMGAAFLAGIGAGLWRGADGLPSAGGVREYLPSMPQETRARLAAEWRRAAETALFWAREG